MRKYIELTGCDSLRNNNITISVDKIVSLQKPTNNIYGCIIETITSKILVKENYDVIKNMLDITNDN